MTTELYPMKVFSKWTIKLPRKLSRKYDIKDGDTIIFIDDEKKGIRIALKEEYLKGVTE